MKPFLLKLDQDVYTQWASAAKLAGLTLSEWIRRAGNAQLPMTRAQQIERANLLADKAVEGLKGLAMPHPETVKAIHKHKKEFDDEALERGSVAQEIARRIGHTVGCECIQCVQAARFLKQQASG